MVLVYLSKTYKHFIPTDLPFYTKVKMHIKTLIKDDNIVTSQTLQAWGPSAPKSQPTLDTQASEIETSFNISTAINHWKIPR